MLKEIRTPCWKSVTEEYSKSEESRNVFCCVGLCGPSSLWYTHLLVFCTFQDVWLSTHNSAFWENFFFLGSWCAKRFNIWPWQFLQRFLDINDIRLVGVQELKSLYTHIFLGPIHFISVSYVGQISTTWRTEEGPTDRGLWCRACFTGHCLNKADYNLFNGHGCNGQPTGINCNLVCQSLHTPHSWHFLLLMPAWEFSPSSKYTDFRVKSS